MHAVQSLVPLLLFFLILHGLLGGLDVIVNHELIVKLPTRPGSAREQRLHSAREAIFASLFIGFAWWEWHGAWVSLPLTLLAGEFAVSLRDAAVEGDSRILPASEATLHVALFVNLGLVFAFAGLVLWQWAPGPAAITGTQYGWASVVLSVLAVLAFGWCVRDLRSARRTERQGAAAGATPG